MNETEQKKNIQAFEGVVAKVSGDKTVAVRVERFFKHPKYHKYIKRSSIIMADDNANAAQVGEKVKIESCRPISKRKSFRIIN